MKKIWKIVVKLGSVLVKTYVILLYLLFLFALIFPDDNFDFSGFRYCIVQTNALREGTGVDKQFYSDYAKHWSVQEMLRDCQP